MRCWIAVLMMILAVASFAAAPKSDLEEVIADAPPLAKPQPEPVKSTRANLFGTLNDQQLLLVGLRMDAAYTAGGAVTQGFTLPGVRFTAWGHAGDLISYRFSLGQAREFSTILLPTLIPTQAYVDFNSSSAMDWDPRYRLTFRLGLFTPTFNPWWSPDLAEIPIPDYSEAHKALFLNRDLGAELIWEPIATRLQFTMGVFNGSGIFSQNTNNSRAVTGSAQGSIFFGPAKWVLGFSAYLREQADPSNINFRSDVVGNLYTSLEIPHWGFRLTGELIAGTLNDSTRTAYPVGGAGTLYLPIIPGLRLFTRAEVVRGTGSGNSTLRNAQIGPILELHKSTQAYIFYQYLETNGAIENMGWVRVRLVL